jgi:hypothetical protein
MLLCVRGEDESEWWGEKARASTKIMREKSEKIQIYSKDIFMRYRIKEKEKRSEIILIY